MRRLAHRAVLAACALAASACGLLEPSVPQARPEVPANWEPAAGAADSA